MTRISRPCYDKPHRCPGWAGGGWKSGGDKHDCDNGSIRTRIPEPGFPGEFKYPGGDGRWRFGHCVGNRHTGSEPCGVVTIPWALRYADPRWWLIYKYRVENWARWTKGWLKP